MHDLKNARGSLINLKVLSHGKNDMALLSEIMEMYIIAKISDLETQLADAQDDLSNLQESLNQEVSDLSTRTKKEISRDRDSLEAKILALTKQNEALKLEVCSQTCVRNFLVPVKHLS